MLPNPYKSSIPYISQAELMEIYKGLIVEFIEKKDARGNTLLDRHAEAPGTAALKVAGQEAYINHLNHYIWGSYCYMMGQTNFHFGHGPPPPLEPPDWLKLHLRPILERWVAK
jgi:hypothetical protein